MQMRESGENYLETILVLSQESDFVRSIDVASTLSYAKPSVSRAMSLLRESGYIDIEKNGAITLTKSGLDKANKIYERHKIITEFLVKVLAVDDTVADADACRIEHIISEESFNKIKEYINS